MDLSPIGVVAGPQVGGASLLIDKTFRPGLDGLRGFSHVMVLWWADETTGAERRELVQHSPYRGGPSRLGVFATRATSRPNPLGVSVAALLDVDQEHGVVHLSHLDAHHGTPVLDIKPYTPSLDKVGAPEVPAWCSGWPSTLEESASFDWDAVLA